MPDKPYSLSEASIKAGQDFGTANKAEALIRKVLLSNTKEFWDETFYKRLKKTSVFIINTCSPSRKGKLQFTEGNLDNLTFLEFNSDRELWSCITQFGIETQLEKTDFLTIKIPPIDPEKNVRYPYNATSVVFRFVCCIIHFDLGKGGSTAMKDLELPIANIFPEAQVKIPLESAETSVVCVAMCIYFKKGIDKIKHPPGKCHAGRIITLYNIVDGEIKKYERPEDLPIKLPPPKPPDKLDWDIL